NPSRSSYTLFLTLPLPAVEKFDFGTPDCRYERVCNNVSMSPRATPTVASREIDGGATKAQ
ncbi:hypothetical protein, partial [Thermoactinospora rubra]|uniref:hypothetical protein n=1 Tax=Thermoactinospora rubra TaxID=1088767 RepID=UPI00198104D9